MIRQVTALVGLALVLAACGSGRSTLDAAVLGDRTIAAPPAPSAPAAPSATALPAAASASSAPAAPSDLAAPLVPNAPAAPLAPRPTAAPPEEDGYDLWLRYHAIEPGPVREAYAARLATMHFPGVSPTLEIARSEWTRGIGGLLGLAPAEGKAVLVGTPASSERIAALGWAEDLAALGAEGYIIRTLPNGGPLVVASNGDVGVLYGVFHLLRLLQTRQPIDALDIAERPRLDLRVLNHWDNLDRSVERGYAGFSLWDWHKLPDYIYPRYHDYARANASIGINGTVLTNVNSNALVLTPRWLEKAAALADTFRPYGIRVYLTARFSAPVEIGGLETADPLDPAVQAWWKDKADEIYALIPDFGGFLVKANSEGQPGPQDYDRTHADGANMLADAVSPHGGVIMWRAFVYTYGPDRDRAAEAFDEFTPLDGTFRPNLLVQVKNGPIDFQPREPFSPLFGGMPETPLMMEFQITKEYLGLATNLAYLGTMWEEVLQADTWSNGEGSTVGRVIDGSLTGYGVTGMAGVANTGTDRNWCGSHFACANWFAYGRLAWDHELGAREIAEEWARATFSNEDGFVEPVVDMMMQSRETFVDYSTPLGLHHIMAAEHHWGPGPWVTGFRPDWTSVYYHRADSLGMGFDRTQSGSGMVEQYHEPVAARFRDRDAVPEDLLLFFHRVEWDEPMDSGRPFWDELALRYQRGVDGVRRMQKTWDEVGGLIDARRRGDVAAFLAIQESEARWWRDACLTYFQTFSKRPLPDGVEPPEHDADYYMNQVLQFGPGTPR